MAGDFDPFLLDPFFAVFETVFDGGARTRQTTFLTVEELFSEEPPALRACPHCVPTSIELPADTAEFVFREVPTPSARETAQIRRIPISSPAPPAAKSPKLDTTTADELEADELEMLAEIVDNGGAFWVEQLPSTDSTTTTTISIYTVQLSD